MSAKPTDGMPERAMWTQLVDSKQLNRIEPETSQAPSEFFLDRERRHAERLEKLEKLRAVRLASAASKDDRHA
jgi:hypothetical protein